VILGSPASLSIGGDSSVSPSTGALEVLDLSKNRLVGSIPRGLGENEVLKYLSLYDNFLRGDLFELTNMLTLRHLDVSRNEFSGMLPAELADLTHLRLLFVGDNKFEAAPIPKRWADINHLHDLSLRQSNRTGPLDYTISTLANSLVYCDLGSNELTGTVPDSIGEMTHLEFLMLNDNPRLKGSVPTTIANLQQLRALFLDGTDISENVSQVCSLPKISKSDGHEVVFADCGQSYDGDTDDAPFHCRCCEHNASVHGCSIPFQKSMRDTWSVDFQTLNFQITNDTVFLNREYIPPYTSHPL
jgi:hypothetical protein